MPDTAPTAAPAASEGRLRLPRREDLSPEAQRDWDANPSANTTLSRLLDLAPTMSPHLRALNVAMATTITVPPMEREVVCIATLTLERGAYEIAQHRVVAARMGISEEKFAAIEHERYGDPLFTPREKALLAFTRQVIKTVRVDDATFAAVSAFYDDRQILELTYVITNYMMLARLSEVAEVPIDGTSGADFWKNRKP